MRRKIWDVFISHAAERGSRTEELLFLIKKELEAKDLTVFVSQEIEVGAPWHPTVMAALADCRAVVVLLDERALASDWVRREVNIIMWRWTLGTHLPIYPVLLDVKKTRALKEAGIPEVATLQLKRTGLEDVPEELAGDLSSRFARLPRAAIGSDPMALWLQRLARRLNEAHLGDHFGDGVLNATAAALEVETGFPGWLADGHGSCAFLASQFLVATPDRVVDAAAALMDFLSDDARQKLVDDLVSVWVPAEAAVALLPPSTGPDGMTVLLNSTYEATPARFIQRATCGANRGYTHRTISDDASGIPTGEGRGSELAEVLEDAVWQEFFPTPPGFEHRRRLPSRTNSPVRYLVVHRTRPPDDQFTEAVRLLHEKFSFIVVVVTTGPEPTSSEMLRGFAYVRSPVLSEQLEVDAEQYVQELRELLVPVSSR
ncbi:toll/interleukin-1 receptor domain-containing protein [Streptomyces erythrochromogenes]|uniref:toll/interleukin-1 receptor domain-containing protein n=1 Tax=Streptomyces erythrochromogenes TaxID=285574 RepID=UPI00382AB5CD